MKKLLLLSIIFSSNLFANLTPEECTSKWDQILENETLLDQYNSFVGKCDALLINEIRKVISTNRDLGYTKARQIMFGSLDNVDGEVCGVYTNVCVKTASIPDPNVMNCEHSWPQSLGAVGIAKSDLHHLYPVMSDVNSRRSNFPFCEVKTYSYEKNGSFLGYSEKGTRCFEPRNEHKGDLSRSMIYFAVRYGKVIDSEQEGFFRKWAELDPVSDKEMNRNDGIEEVQLNRNPFIDHPFLLNLISDI